MSYNGFVFLLQHKLCVSTLLVISDFCCFSNEIFNLLGCYKAQIGTYRRFGKMIKHTRRIFLESLTLEDGADMLSRTVSN